MSRRGGSVARRRKPWEDITPIQYEKGWQLVSTGHTMQQVIAATGLTKPQLVWLVKVGDESRGMPSYHQRVAEQSAMIRARAQEAAEEVGIGAVESLKGSVEITKTTQGFAKKLIDAHMTYKVGPTMAKLAEKTQKGEEITDVDLQGLALPKGVRETLKVLRPYTDFSSTASAFRTVFDSPLQKRDPVSQLPKEVRLDLSGENMLPAAVAIVEELDKGEVGHDLLDDLMPAYKGWTADEIEHYLETGEMPAREYGDEEQPSNVIDVAPSREKEENET